MDKFIIADAVDFHRQVDETPNLGALSSCTAEASVCFGFRWFTLIRGARPAKSDGSSFLLTNYPQAWVDDVFKNKRHLDDPLHAAASRSVDGLSWDEIDQYVKMNCRQKETILNARKFGLRSGFTFARRLNSHPNAIFTVSRRSTAEISIQEKIIARVVGDAAFTRAHALSSGTSTISATVNISPRQLDCIALLAKGYSDFEIARKLEISVETVREYIEKARRSYGVKRRFQLAILAVRDGYLSPGDVE